MLAYFYYNPFLFLLNTQQYIKHVMSIVCAFLIKFGKVI